MFIYSLPRDVLRYVMPCLRVYSDACYSF